MPGRDRPADRSQPDRDRSAEDRGESVLAVGEAEHDDEQQHRIGSAARTVTAPRPDRNAERAAQRRLFHDGERPATPNSSTSASE